MASNRKYAGLPDLDLAPDIYETPELTDDNTSTTQAGQSERSPYDQDDDEIDTEAISRRRLNPDAARSHFLSSRVDARDADFSERIDAKRKAYRVSTRRKKKGGAGGDEDEDEDDTEEDSSDEELEEVSNEGLKRRMARLMRQAQEIKAEIERREEEESEEEDGVNGAALEQLVRAMRVLGEVRMPGEPQSAEARLALRLGEASKSGSSKPPKKESAGGADDPLYTITYAPSFSQSHALALAASFDTRLSKLEANLGLSAMPLPTQLASAASAAPVATPLSAADPADLSKPLLPTLAHLDRQLSALAATLASTSPAALDALAKRLRQLTQDADTLEERRRAAKNAWDEFRTAQQAAAALESATSPTSATTSGPASSAANRRASVAAAAAGGGANSAAPPKGAGSTLLEDTETHAKVAALHATLGTVTQLAPLLPGVLERLRSLRLLHADAAGAAARLAEVERRAAEAGEEARRWREAVERVEEAVAESEEVQGANAKMVEGWVRELEGRIRALDKGR